MLFPGEAYGGGIFNIGALTVTHCMLFSNSATGGEDSGSDSGGAGEGGGNKRAATSAPDSPSTAVS